MKSNKSFSVGDTVVMTDVNHAEKHTTVTRVGRKYVYVSASAEPFDMVGRVVDRYGHRRIYGLVEWQRRENAFAARRELEQAGLGVAYHITQDDLLEVVALLGPWLSRKRQEREAKKT